MALVSCSPKLVKWNDGSITKKEFETHLLSLDSEHSKRIVKEKTLYSKELGKCATNKIIYNFINKNKITKQLLNSNQWRNELQKTVQFFLQKSETPHTNEITEKEIMKFTTEYQINLFYVPMNTEMPLIPGDENAEIIFQIRNDFSNKVPFGVIANRYSPASSKRGEQTHLKSSLSKPLQAQLDSIELNSTKYFNLSNTHYFIKMTGKEKTDKDTTFFYQQIVIYNTPEAETKISQVEQALSSPSADFNKLVAFYSEDTNNFTFGKWPNASLLNRYWFIVPWLEFATPGVTLKELKLPGSYVYIEYLEKIAKQPTEVKSLKNDPQLIRQIAQTTYQIKDHTRRLEISKNNLIRNYDLLTQPNVDLEKTIFSIKINKKEVTSYSIKQIAKEASWPDYILQSTNFQGNLVQLANEIEQFALQKAYSVWSENFKNSSMLFTTLYNNSLSEFALRNLNELDPQANLKLMQRLKETPLEIIYQKLPKELFQSEIEISLLNNKNKKQVDVKKSFSSLENEYKLISKISSNKKKQSESARKKTEEKLKEIEIRIEQINSNLDTKWSQEGYKLTFATNVLFHYYNKNDMRRTKEWILKATRSTEYTHSYITNLYHNSDQKRKWLLLDSFGQIRKPEVTLFLSNILENANLANNIEDICFAIESLGKHKKNESIEQLKKYYQHEIWGVRLLAGQALENITGESFPVEMPTQTETTSPQNPK